MTCRASRRILQLNSDGFVNKKLELKVLMKRLAVHAAILQESKLHQVPIKSLILPNFTTESDRTESGDDASSDSSLTEVKEIYRNLG